jgi:hypothetical protein
VPKKVIDPDDPDNVRLWRFENPLPEVPAHLAVTSNELSVAVLLLARELDPKPPNDSRPGAMSALLPRGTARYVVPRFFYALGQLIRYREQTIAGISFDQISFISKTDAERRGGKDWWRTETSVEKAYYKFRTHFAPLIVHVGRLTLLPSIEKVPGQPFLAVSVVAQADVEILLKPKEQSWTLPVEWFFFVPSSVRLRWEQWEAFEHSSSALGTALFKKAITVYTGVPYSFPMIPKRDARFIDWGDESPLYEVPENGTVTHIFEREGPLTIRIQGSEDRDWRVYDGIIIAINPAAPTASEEVHTAVRKKWTEYLVAAHAEERRKPRPK